MKKFFLTMCLFLFPVTAAIGETNHFNTKYDYNDSYNPDYRLDMEGWLKENNIKRPDKGGAADGEVGGLNYLGQTQVEENCGGIPTVDFRPIFETTTDDFGRNLRLFLTIKPTPYSKEWEMPDQLVVKTSKTSKFMASCFAAGDVMGCVSEVGTFTPNSIYNKDPRELMNAEQISLEKGGDQIVLFKKGTCEGLSSAFDKSITDYLEFIDLFAKHRLVPLY